MSAFEPGWLRLREPFDATARSAVLAEHFAAGLPEHPRLLDLGAGTGANFRHLAPVIGRDQDWLLVDHDPTLLALQAAEIERWVGDTEVTGGQGLPLLLPRSEARAGSWRVDQQCADLTTDLDRLPWDRIDGVTASALLDLVSADWLNDLADRLAARRLPALFVLTYDGRMVWQPPDPADEAMRIAFNHHQGGVKSFGRALGPHAADRLTAALTGHGYRIRRATSDWRIEEHRIEEDRTGTATTQMIEALIGGIVQAVGEMLGPGDAGLGAEAEAWRRRRQATLIGRRLTIGHLDLLALPPV